MNEIRLVLRPNASSRQLTLISEAVGRWLVWAADHDMIRRLEIVVKGGPYLGRNEMLETWRAILPAGLVEELVVEGEEVDG